MCSQRYVSSLQRFDQFDRATEMEGESVQLWTRRWSRSNAKYINSATLWPRHRERNDYETRECLAGEKMWGQKSVGSAEALHRIEEVDDV